MPQRNAPNRQTASAERRAGARFVGTDEFKHELLKFARRSVKEGKPIGLIGVQLTNESTLKAVADQEALDRLDRGIRSTITRIAGAAQILTVVSAGRFLVLSLGEADEIADGLRAKLGSLTVTGCTVRPSFDVQLASCVGDEVDSALAAVGCHIDEHGELRELTRDPVLSELGTMENWQKRYDGDLDTWRNVRCRIESFSVGDNMALTMRRAKTLMALDHPGLEVLRDFWLDERECVCVTDMIGGKPFVQWVASHELNEAARVDLLLQYISVLIYGRSLTPPLHFSGLEAKLIVVPGGETRMMLSDYQKDILLAGEDTDTEKDFVQDVEHFAARLGVDVPQERSTLHKMRAALKDVAEKLGAPRAVPKEASHA